jgi:hypothetical protein
MKGNSIVMIRWIKESGGFLFFLGWVASFYFGYGFSFEQRLFYEHGFSLGRQLLIPFLSFLFSKLITTKKRWKMTIDEKKCGWNFCSYI